MASSKKQPAAPAKKAAPAKPAAKQKPKPKKSPDADRAPGPSGGLAVLVDGVALPPDAAEAVWRAFSAWMDENQGDLDGFAKQRGFASVKPEYRRGQAVLVVTR
jgi:hypothetical protein